MKKRSQSEIIGLLTIVVLFIFAGLIYIMLAGKGGQDTLTRDVVKAERVRSMLGAFRQVTPCYEKTPYDPMETIIKNCYTSAGSLTVCGEPCKDVITRTLEEAIKAYNPKQEYWFKILKGKEEFISIDKCTKTTETQSDKITLSAGSGVTLTVQLVYCT